MNDVDFRVFIERVREQTDIVQVIGQYLELHQNKPFMEVLHELARPKAASGA